MSLLINLGYILMLAEVMAIGYYLLYFTVIFPMVSVYRILRVGIMVKYWVVLGLVLWLVLGVFGEGSLGGFWGDLWWVAERVGEGVRMGLGVGKMVGEAGRGVGVQVVGQVWSMVEGLELDM